MKKLFSLFSTLLLLTGCATSVPLPEVNLKYVENFKGHELKDGNDIGIYILRPKNSFGASKRFWVALDDHVIGTISNNSYVFMPVNSANNDSINLVKNMTGTHQFSIPKNPNKKYYFIKVGHGTREAELLDDDIGKTLVGMLEHQELDYKVRVNDGYDTLLMNPSNLVKLTEKSNSKQPPILQGGSVTFIRSDTTHIAERTPSIDIWSDDLYIGSLREREYITVPLPIGKHTFYRYDGKYHGIELNIEENSHFYIEMDLTFEQIPFVGATFYHHKFKPLNPFENVSNKKSTEWLSDLKSVSLIQSEHWSKEINNHINNGFNFMITHKSKFQDATKNITAYNKKNKR